MKAGSAKQAPATRAPLHPALVFAALFVALLVAYGPALDGRMVWDDDQHLPSPAFFGLDGLVRYWFELGATPQYYPLTHTLFWIQHQLWGRGFVGYHVVNVAFHALNATLVFVLMRRLRIPGALLGAALFALHPVQVESVAWMSELKNTLSGACFLGALLCYLRFARPLDEAEAAARGRAWALALALFAGALLSKAVTATLPGVVLVVLWFRDGRLSWRRDVAPLLPFFGVALAAGLFSAWMEEHHVGAQGEAFDLAPVQRFLLAGRALVFYAGKLAWPAGLTFSYPRWGIDAASPLAWVYSLLVLAAIGTAAALVRRVGRGPLAGILIFCGVLFPALGFVNVFPFQYSFVADHFQYLACAGLLVLAAAGGARLAARLAPPGPDVARGAAALLLVVYGLLCWRQSADYQDEETLWRATLARNPTSWMAHTNLGVLLAKRGRYEDAIASYRAALEEDPARGWTHFNWANALAALGRREEAIEHFERALELGPEACEMHNNLARELEARGDVEAAIAHYERAIERRPDFATGHYNLGATLARQGRVDEAIPHYQRAIALDPRYAPPRNNLGIALALQGRNEEAAASFRAAIAVQPIYPEAYNNLGMTLRQMGELDAAIGMFRTALQQRPSYPNAQQNLEQALAARGKRD